MYDEFNNPVIVVNAKYCKYGQYPKRVSVPCVSVHKIHG